MNAPFAPHPFDSNLLLPADGLIVHANYEGGNLGTGLFLNHPTLPISPDINLDLSQGFDVADFLDAPFTTNAEPTLEDFSLIYANTSQSYENPYNPDFGFGHGMMFHKRAAVNNCTISGFPGDGIRVVGTNSKKIFLEGQRIWGLFYQIDGIFIANPPDIQHEENQHTPAPEDLLPVNYIDFRFLNYFELDPIPYISKNLKTDLDVNFLRTTNNTLLSDETVLENLEIEILIGGEDFAALLLPFLQVDFGDPPPDPTTADSVEFHLFADTASFPYGEIPIRIKATYDSGAHAVSEVFYIYACDNIHNAYPRHVYTNANVSQIYNTRIFKCKRNGLYIAGIDSNASTIVGLTTNRNRGWGIYDNSALGNTYIGCHSEGNETGAYTTGVLSDVNRNLFLGCTGEGIVKLETPTQWIGGSSEQTPNYYPDGDWRNGASILQQGGIFPLYNQVVRFRNSTGIDPDPEDGVWGGAGVFFEAGPKDPVDIFGFGHTNSREWALSVKELLNKVTGTGNSPYYVFSEANADAGRALSLSGFFTGNEIPPGMPYFFNPILMSKNDEEGEKKIRITVGIGKPPLEDVYHDGLPVYTPGVIPLTTIKKIVGDIGDIHFNSSPKNESGLDYVAWICTEPFQFDIENPTASIEAVWKPFWLIAF
ncbi:MAG: right-handed parallel beta-helix repeat-containing protein [Sphingobacteriales bacterium]|nr:MAG: right-handed parallel beta-helix repeat-containing protein [Sphingobacteriales bacterium]